MNNFLLTLLLVLSGTLAGFAQQGNIWYFGRNAGLDFNGGAPVALTDGQIDTYEGCATIADQNGQLLFYTDGITVWNRNHRVMPNGNGLNGDPSATQSGIIVPYPGNQNLYYIFTIDDLEDMIGRDGLQHSLVDMSADGGFGDIITKNVPLLAETTEKISATVHQNGRDYWVVTHTRESNEFYTYRITEDGLNEIPIISAVGRIHEGENSWAGYLKVSPDGSKIAAALAKIEGSFVQVVDFDNATGQITNPIELTGFRSLGAYGIEFSPNSQLLYVTDANYFDTFEDQGLYQYDLSSDMVFASRVEVAIDIALAGLQLAPDGKIYVSRAGSAYLGVINEPDQLGAASNYVSEGVDLEGRTAEFGLPTFVQSFFLEADFEAEDLCFGDDTQFILSENTSEGEYLWIFGDPDSGDTNASTEEEPTHAFSAPGTYTVSLTVTADGNSETVTEEIEIEAPPTVDLGEDLVLEAGTTTILDAGVDEPGTTYRWQDGTTQPTYLVGEAGQYWVDVFSAQGCLGTDTVNVTFDQQIEGELGNDTTLCAGETLTLDVTQEGATYEWQDGSTEGTFEVSEAGTYFVDITNALGNRSKRSSIEVSYFNFGGVQIADTTACGGPVVLTARGAEDDEVVYRWYASEGDEEPLAENDGTFTTPELAETTTYYVALASATCEGERTPVVVAIDGAAAQVEPAQATIQFGESVELQASGGVSYAWSPAEGLDDDAIANPVAQPLDNTTYTVTITSESGCQTTLEVPVTVRRTLVVPNLISPNDDNINDAWEIENLERFPGHTVRIFNRAGALLMETTNYDQQWKGTYRGNDLPEDTYFYVIDRNDGYEPQRGTLSIVR